MCQRWSGVRGATLFVTHPKWEPYAGKPLVRFCAGAISDGRPYRNRYTKNAQEFPAERSLWSNFRKDVLMLAIADDQRPLSGTFIHHEFEPGIGGIYRDE